MLTNNEAVESDNRWLPESGSQTHLNTHVQRSSKISENRIHCQCSVWGTIAQRQGESAGTLWRTSRAPSVQRRETGGHSGRRRTCAPRPTRAQAVSAAKKLKLDMTHELLCPEEMWIPVAGQGF